MRSMTIRPSKLYSIEPAAGVEEVEEMYLEVEYEGFFDGTKVCALSAIVINLLSSHCCLLADILLAISLILRGT